MSRASDIVKLLQKDNPSIQFYWTKKRHAIGYWSHNLNRVQVLVAEILGGGWARMPEILVNGKPCLAADDWEPIRFEDLA
jgi:hypothetical protein